MEINGEYPKADIGCRESFVLFLHKGSIKGSFTNKETINKL